MPSPTIGPFPNDREHLERMLALAQNPTPEDERKIQSRWGMTPAAFITELHARLKVAAERAATGPANPAAPDQELLKRRFT